jgi:hypothetical protein
MSRPLATTITFLISALAHELVMGCITRKFRGYGFFAMMLQMPIVMVQRSKWVKGRTLLNNVLFWCSMILGLSMVSGHGRITYGIVLMLYRCVLFMSWCEGVETRWVVVVWVTCMVFVVWRWATICEIPFSRGCKFIRLWTEQRTFWRVCNMCLRELLQYPRSMHQQPRAK